jgi:hypothetical protein
MFKLFQVSPAGGKDILNLIKSQGRVEDMFRGQVFMVPDPRLIIRGVYNSLHMTAYFHSIAPALNIALF